MVKLSGYEVSKVATVVSSTAPIHHIKETSMTNFTVHQAIFVEH